MSSSGDVQDEIVVRILFGVAGSFDRDNTHGWWPVSSLARSFIRSVVGRSLARSSIGSFSRSLGRSVALSLVVSAAPFPPSLDRSAARSSAGSVSRALVTSLSCFLVRSFARLLACERWFARLLVRLPARSFAFALVSSRRPSVRSFARARSFVLSFALLARSLVRSATRFLGRSVAHTLGRSVADSFAH